MPPEEKRKLDELYEWMLNKKRQQISLPLDDASRNVIGGARGDGAGSSTLTQNKSLSGEAETITVPAAYIGTRLVIIEGTRYEIPYISTS